MTTFDEARAARIAAAQATPQEWRDLAADMWDELKAFDDAVEAKAIRYVKTPAGARKYGEPIGAPIRPNGPKLDYTRRGPKRKGGGSASSSGSSSPFRSVDVSAPEATKKVTELTPGERGREKARLQEAVKKGAGDYERQRLRDIERHENELDATVRKAGERVTPKPSTTSPKDTPKPDPKTQPVRDLTDAQVRQQLSNAARDAVGYNGSRAEVARARELGDEFRRRGLGDSPRELADRRIQAEADREDARKARQAQQARERQLEARANRADPSRLGDPAKISDRELTNQINDIQEAGSRATRAQQDRLDALLEERSSRRRSGGKPQPRGVGLSPEDLTDDALDAAMKKIGRKKKLTAADRERDRLLVAEFNRREGSRARSQARRLVGKSDAEFDVLWNRLSIEGKVLELFGENDWDCSHMDDDDITLFLVKALSGRPTVEKLTQADALLAERFDRLASDDVEVKELTWETN